MIKTFKKSFLVILPALFAFAFLAQPTQAQAAESIQDYVPDITVNHATASFEILLINIKRAEELLSFALAMYRSPTKTAPLTISLNQLPAAT